MKTNSNTLEDKKDRFTPGKWFVDYGDKLEEILIRINVKDEMGASEAFDLCSFESDETENIKANAEHIVKCVNAFPELVAALQMALNVGDFNEKHEIELQTILTKVKS